MRSKPIVIGATPDEGCQRSNFKGHRLIEFYSKGSGAVNLFATAGRENRCQCLPLFLSSRHKIIPQIFGNVKKNIYLCNVIQYSFIVTLQYAEAGDE